MSENKLPSIQEYQFPRNWYEDEVRDGFFVSGTMKRNWAGQLAVLRDIDAVCRKLHLTWYMDGGTLLGAARNGGYIPWDDDLDIAMMRSDLEIFREKAQELLPPGYWFNDCRQRKETVTDVFRVISASSITMESKYLEHFHGCPFILGVDIFALDNLSADSEYEAQRAVLSETLKKCCDLMQKEDSGAKTDLYALVQSYEKASGRKIAIDQQLHNTLRCEIIRLNMEVQDNQSKRVCNFWDTKLVFERDWFGEPVMIPFEGMLLPAPAKYEKSLEVEYGNWRYPVRGGSGHDYPCYREQAETLRQTLGRHPDRYTFRLQDLESTKPESPRVKTRRCLELLRKIDINLCQVANHEETRRKLLLSAQKMVLSLTEILTPLFPDVSEPIAALKSYGEVILQVFSVWANDSLSSLNNAFSKSNEQIRFSLENRFEIVFLPCRASWWGSMEPLWRYAASLPTAQVKVCPIPWYEEPVIGEKGMRHDEMELFPAELGCISCETYDLISRHPEVIVIQVPYDNMNRNMLIDETYYSYRLKDYADRLIYVPCFTPDTPSDEDEVAAVAMEELIEQPAVMFADEVRVPSSQMREIYIKTLTGLSGKDTYEYWAKKIKADDSMDLSMHNTLFEM